MQHPFGTLTLLMSPLTVEPLKPEIAQLTQ